MTCCWKILCIVTAIVTITQSVWANSLTPIEVTKITDGESIERQGAG